MKKLVLLLALLSVFQFQLRLITNSGVTTTADPKVWPSTIPTIFLVVLFPRSIGKSGWFTWSICPTRRVKAGCRVPSSPACEWRRVASTARKLSGFNPAGRVIVDRWIGVRFLCLDAKSAFFQNQVESDCVSETQELRFSMFWLPQTCTPDRREWSFWRQLAGFEVPNCWPVGW